MDTLKGKGPFTVFAPTDAAFAEIDPEVLSDLLADTELLAAVLTYHVVPGKIMAGDIAGKETEVKTVQGDKLDVNAKDGVVVSVTPTGWQDPGTAITITVGAYTGGGEPDPGEGEGEGDSDG